MTKRFAPRRLALRTGLALAAVLAVTGGSALAAGPSPTAITWTAGTPLPFGATRFDGALVGGKVYFPGFRAADNTTSGEVWYYDIAADTYVDTGVAMPVPVSNYTASVLKDPTGTGIYTIGGRDATGAIINTVQVYYPATNTVAVIDTDPFKGKTPSKCVSLPATGVAVVKNKAYVLGGMSFSTSVPPCTDDNSAQVWRFDPMAPAHHKWKKQPPLTAARGYVTAAVVGSTIYAIGGDVNSAGTLTAQTTVDSWKVGSPSWNAATADLPQPCDESQAFGFAKGQLAKTVTLAGCGQFPLALPDVLQYDVATDTWSTNGALNEARRNQAGANIGTAKKPKLFVVGGYNSDSSVTLMTSEVGTP
jgi:Kelch motif protein